MELPGEVEPLPGEVTETVLGEVGTFYTRGLPGLDLARTQGVWVMEH